MLVEDNSFNADGGVESEGLVSGLPHIDQQSRVSSIRTWDILRIFPSRSHKRPKTELINPEDFSF